MPHAPAAMGKGTLLFVDEVHRFNRAQQDSFLPVMEDGTVVLVGATTENPSFELNAALLSRARVLVFQSLDPDAVEKLYARAEEVQGKSCRWMRKPAPCWCDGRWRWPRRADAGGGSLARRARR
jgi:replication-associated recombination protein RarA